MRRIFVILVAAMTTLCLAAVAFGQTPAPTEEPSQEATEAATPTPAEEGPLTPTVSAGPVISLTQVLTSAALESEAAPFVSLNLAAGAAIDPFLVSINGGGPVDVSTISGEGECVGYIAAAPTVAVNWSGGSDFVSAFVYSDHDPVLVIQLPDGRFLCNDDANDALLDPAIDLEAPPIGTYRIWVGSYDAGQLVPAILVLTTSRGISHSSFNLANLVQRAPVPEDVTEPEDLRPGELPQVELPADDTATQQRDLEAEIAQELIPLTPDDLPLAQTVVVTGTVPTFDLPTGDVVCTGFINDQIDLVFSWTGSVDNLRIYFEGDQDASLLVVSADGDVYCNDDSGEGDNLNPQVDIPNPTSAGYLVQVGRLAPTGTLTGVLHIAPGTSEAPALLPAATE